MRFCSLCVIFYSYIVVAMSTPPFSSNAQKILDRAVELAVSRRHPTVGTEHLAREICHSSNRAVEWVAQCSFPHSSDPLAELRRNCDIYFESRPSLLGSKEEEKGESKFPVYSDALQRVLDIARQIGTNPVQDGNFVHAEGLVASEFLLAALFIEGTGIGADLFCRISHGAVNANVLLEAIRVDPKHINRPDVSDGLWQEYSVPPAAVTHEGGQKPTSPAPWFPNVPLDSLHDQIPTAPTDSSNWLIPGRLLIGEHPSKKEVRVLLNAGVDTFVSLIGEYRFPQYKEAQYPAAIADMHHELTVPVSFLHFPVRDFGATSVEALKSLVSELKHRILQGHTLFVHCRGGHGRTGMVVIPLMSALYDVPVAEAQQYVVHSTATTRRNDRAYPQYVHMPEAEEQWAAVQQVEGLVRGQRR